MKKKLLSILAIGLLGYSYVYAHTFTNDLNRTITGTVTSTINKTTEHFVLFPGKSYKIIDTEAIYLISFNTMRALDVNATCSPLNNNGTFSLDGNDTCISLDGKVTTWTYKEKLPILEGPCTPLGNYDHGIKVNDKLGEANNQRFASQVLFRCKVKTKINRKGVLKLIQTPDGNTSKISFK